MTDVVQALRAALAKGGSDVDALLKATFNQPSTATTGLQIYDLEGPAKNLYPVLTPLRNAIPRVSGAGGIQANWRAVTAIDTGAIRPGVPEGRRGGVVAVTVREYLAAYRTIGAESNVTYEAELAAGSFDDLRARASTTQLQALMLAEESLILGGNTSLALGVTPTPTLAQASTGGALGAATYSVICVALSFTGRQINTVAAGLTPTVTRVAADGTSDTMSGGIGRKSAAASIVVASGTTNAVTATVAAVRGAFAYAWFWGTASNELLGAITTTNQYVITAAATGTQNASAISAGTDNSTDPFIFDGLLTMAATAANNGYYVAAAAGAGLTADGQGGIVEFDTALQWYWDNLRLSPTKIIISGQEMLYIRKKILAGSSVQASVRFVFQGNQNGLIGGSMPVGYTNPFSMTGSANQIPLMLHPNMPPGAVLFLTEEIPYPMSNVANVLQIRARRDYYQIDWPQRTRLYEYGVYSDEVLQHYFPASLGMITNLAPA